MRKNIIVLDTETTGTDESKDRVVQLCMAKVDPDYRILEKPRTILINPDMPISPGAMKVHGITDEMVKDKPTFGQYARSIRDYCEGCDFAGYNIIRFDMVILNREFADRGYQWPDPAANMFDGYKIYSLKERRDLTAAMAFYCNSDHQDAHDAEADVMATIQVMKAQLDFYPEFRDMDAAAIELFCRDGKPRVDMSGKLYRNEEGVICFGLGKSKGIPVVSDPGFANWMINNQDFPVETRFILEQVLKGKMK